MKQEEKNTPLQAETKPTEFVPTAEKVDVGDILTRITEVAPDDSYWTCANRFGPAANGTCCCTEKYASTYRATPKNLGLCIPIRCTKLGVPIGRT